MFIHYGLYSQVGRNEWVMALENIPIEEYEKLTDTFRPKPGAPREWAALAKRAGMKYMVMTTRHHEGFSLWDSKANLYNSVNLGPKRDIVREFVDACREYGLGIGFYSSLMDWHHRDRIGLRRAAAVPDGQLLPAAPRRAGHHRRHSAVGVGDPHILGAMPSRSRPPWRFRSAANPD